MRACDVNEVTTIAGALILDVREPDEFAAGTLEGAINIPLGDLTARLTALPRDRTIACLCRSGNRSGSAQQILEHNGFVAVNLTGGMLAWRGHE